MKDQITVLANRVKGYEDNIEYAQSKIADLQQELNFYKRMIEEYTPLLNNAMDQLYKEQHLSWGCTPDYCDINDAECPVGRTTNSL